MYLPLQVCVVSLVGFVMLCISYQPDEKTCVQFTVKVPSLFLISSFSHVVKDRKVGTGDIFKAT